MNRSFLLGLLVCGIASAQNYIGTDVFANIPKQCNVGTLYFATDKPAGQNIYGCTSLNTWTQQGGSSSGSVSITATDGTIVVNPSPIIGTGTIKVGTVPNANLANASTTVNGQTCTLGATCTVATATIPSVTNLISGDGAGNGANSNIAPASVVTLTGAQALSNKTITANVIPTVTSISAQAVIGSGNTMTINAPASISNGNALIAIIKNDAINNTQTWTPATGFTQVGTTIGSTASSKTLLSVFCKTAASESGNYTFTWTTSGAQLAVGYILNVAGASCTNDGIGTAVGNVSTLTINPATTALGNDLLVFASTQSGSSSVATPNTPGNVTKRIQSNGMYIGTVPNGGNGATPSATQLFANSGGAASSQDSAFTVIAFPGSATANTAPVSSGSAAVLSSLNLTNGLDAGGQIQASTFAVNNAGGGCISSGAFANSYAIYSTGGTLHSELCLNANNNLEIDPSEFSPYIVFGNGAKGGAKLLLSSGEIDYISQDITQDLRTAWVNSSNDLNFGDTSTASEQGLHTTMAVPAIGSIQLAPNAEPYLAVDSTNGVTVANTAAGALGAEVFTNGALTGGTSWSVTGDWALSSNTAVYLDSTHAGTLTQAAASFATPVVADTRYVLNYTVTASTQTGYPAGNPACTIPTSFASRAEQITMQAGTAPPFSFTTAASPGDFSMSCTSSAGKGFTIDNLSLKAATTGNLRVAGAIAAGGTMSTTGLLIAGSNINAGSSSALGWTGRSVMTSSGNGTVKITTNNTATAGLLQLGSIQGLSGAPTVGVTGSGCSVGTPDTGSNSIVGTIPITGGGVCTITLTFAGSVANPTHGNVCSALADRTSGVIAGQASDSASTAVFSAIVLTTSDTVQYGPCAGY